MRRFSLFLLLASAAVPALAAPGDDDQGGRHQRTESNERSEARAQRAENRSERAAERQQLRAQQAEERQFGAQRSERARPADQGTAERIRERIELRQQQAASTQSSHDNAVREFRGRGRDEVSGQAQSSWRPRERQIRTIPDTRPQVTQPSVQERRIFADRNRRDYRNGNYTRWSRDWHRDSRYDWRRWRDRHRSSFRIGFYYDPFGWSYRRWSLGSFLYPSYYSSRYWLNDPWQYRLPPAYGPYRWVRYWDDALLVNIYTGEVVDVINDFFW